MSVGTFHALWSLLILGLFLGVVFWAWSSKRKQSFDEAARIPLEDDDAPAAKLRKENENG